MYANSRKTTLTKGKYYVNLNIIKKERNLFRLY